MTPLLRLFLQAGRKDLRLKQSVSAFPDQDRGREKDAIQAQKCSESELVACESD
jgi:hypothetical protein